LRERTWHDDGATEFTERPAMLSLQTTPTDSAADLWPGIAGRLPKAPAEGLKMATLLEFKQLMAHEGWPLQLARMCYDRLYAYERIAQAHASAHDPLRRIALQLFQAYHAIDETTPLASRLS
jgi:hypothetical protein